jgi:hypothetical protein
MQEDAGAIIAIVKVLAKADYMDLARDCFSRRYGVARGLARRGVTAATMELLWEYALDTGDQPAGLLAHWMSKPTIGLKKIEEMLSKPQWVAKVTQRFEDAEVSGDAAPIHSLREHRRSM